MSITITDDETVRGQGLAAVAHLDARTPLWDADAVRAWHVAHPGSPGRPRE